MPILIAAAMVESLSACNTDVLRLFNALHFFNTCLMLFVFSNFCSLEDSSRAVCGHHDFTQGLV